MSQYHLSLSAGDMRDPEIFDLVRKLEARQSQLYWSKINAGINFVLDTYPGRLFLRKSVEWLNERFDLGISEEVLYGLLCLARTFVPGQENRPAPTAAPFGFPGMSSFITRVFQEAYGTSPAASSAATNPIPPEARPRRFQHPGPSKPCQREEVPEKVEDAKEDAKEDEAEENDCCSNPDPIPCPSFPETCPSSTPSPSSTPAAPDMGKVFGNLLCGGSQNPAPQLDLGKMMGGVLQIAGGFISEMNKYQATPPSGLD